jgi:hypothetical protein
VVDSFANAGIPLENICQLIDPLDRSLEVAILTTFGNAGTDIDYMKQYRDFEMDPNTFSITEGQQFLSKLHGKVSLISSISVLLILGSE